VDASAVSVEGYYDGKFQTGEEKFCFNLEREIRRQEPND